MGLNYADVNLLNNAMENAGNAFAQRRAQQNQEQRDMQQELIRRQMLGVEQERAAATGAHETRMENIATTSAAQRDKQEMLKTAITLNAGGQLDDEGIKSVNDWIEKDPDLSKTGIHIKAPPQKAPPQVGQNSVAQALAFAQQLEAAGNADDAAILRKWAKKQSEDYDTITEKFPGKDEVKPTEAKNPLIGSATPATPGSPAIPERTVTRHVPAGTFTPPTAAASKGKPTRALAKQYVDKYGADAKAQLTKDGYDISGYAD